MGFIQCHINEFLKEFEKDNQERIKAGQRALKVEAFRLSNVLKEELLADAPGGKKFSPFSAIARRLREPSQARKRTPMGNLFSRFISYQVRKEVDSGRYVIELGFTSLFKKKGMERIMEIAKEQQEGRIYKRPPFIYLKKGRKKKKDVSSYRPPKTFGGLIAILGAEKKSAGDSEAKYFFLRKSTTSFRLPSRDIIDSFWGRHKEETIANIKENYERILNGERI